MKKRFALIALAGFLSGGVAEAFDWFDGRLSLGGGYGIATPRLDDTFQDQYKEGHMWTANVKYFINNDVSVIGSYADLQVKNKTSPSDIHFRPAVASVRYNLIHHFPITPYILAGAGGSFNRMENVDGSESKWTQFTAQGGLGLEFFINEHTSIGAEALYHHFLKKNRNYYGVPSAVATMNLYFGEGPSTRRAKEEAAAQKQRADAAVQQVSEADQRAAEAAAAALAAQQLTQGQQAQTAQAQAELDAIKEMIARKDLQPINFRTGSSELLDESHGALNKIAETAKKYPNFKLRVEGHTDSQGSDTYNLNLSQKRADSVRAYLKSVGVSPDQVVAAGFGETRPIASNDTVEGRATNRRVEFLFFLK